MATGYEVQMYRDIERIRKALEKIASHEEELCELLRRLAMAKEHEVFQTTREDVREASRRLAEDLGKQ